MKLVRCHKDKYLVKNFIVFFKKGRRGALWKVGTYLVITVSSRHSLAKA